MITLLLSGDKKQFCLMSGQQPVPPCVEEFPMIVDLGKEIHDLEIVFVSADFDDKINEVIDFLNDQHVYRVSYIKNEKDQPFINGIHSTWTGSLPFTILFGKRFWRNSELLGRKGTRK